MEQSMFFTSIDLKNKTKQKKKNVLWIADLILSVAYSLYKF